MKLKNIIHQFDMLTDCIIYQGDTKIHYKDPDNEWEEVYKGTIMDIPWYFLNFYLTPTSYGAVSCYYEKETNKTRIEFNLCEFKEAVKYFLEENE